MAKKLNKLDLLKLSSIDTASEDFIAFAAKSDGLYQKIGQEENKIATTKELSDKVKTDVPKDAVFTDTVYEHPKTHDASIIVESPTKKFVSDAEKAEWNAKETVEGSTAKASSALTDAKEYVDGIVKTPVPENAKFTDTVYEHPETHSAEIITETDDKKFVTEEEKDTWNAKETPAGTDAKVNDALTSAKNYVDGRVKTPVPDDAIFTDTIVDISGKSDIEHNHNLSDLTEKSYNSLTDKPILGTSSIKNTGVSEGDIPILGVGGKLDVNTIPKIAISETSVVATQALMLALTAEIGDIAIRTDLNTSFILKKEPASTLANWQELLTPMSPVQSVAGHVGVVTLTKVDVGLKNIDNTSDMNKPVSTAQGVAIGLKADKTYVDERVKTPVPVGALFTDTKYTHPDSHPASMIIETTAKNFVSDTEKAGWNAKETTAGATSKANQALEDAKDYVDGRVKTDVPAGAKFTDTIVDISGKVDKVSGKGLSANDYTDAEKTKLSGVEAGANKYTHPSGIYMSSAERTKLTGIEAGANKYAHPTTHPASIIVQDISNRFVTDAEKTGWNAKETTAGATSKANQALEDAKDYVDGRVKTDVPANAKFTDTNTTYGLMTSTELTGGTVATSRVVSAKLLSEWLGAKVQTDVPVGAKFTDTVYSHPTKHPADIITQTTSARFVSDAEKTTWDEKETPDGAQEKATKALTDATAYVDGKVLTDVPANAKFTDTIVDITGKVDKVSGKGLSTNDYTTAEKTKLSGIAANANKYTHPTNHPASIITETTTKRFVTDAEKTTWNEKETPDGAQEKADTALGSATAYVDTKVKTNVPAGAVFTDTKYTHPTNHPASIITQTTSARFVSDAEKATWGDKETPEGAQTKATKAFTDATAYVDDKVDSINADILTKADKGHNHTLLSLSERNYSNLTNKPSLGTASSKNTGTSSGNIPILGSDGKLNDIVIPKIAISETSVIGSEALMLALTAEIGDIAIRTDLSKTFILKKSPASTLANWQELETPASPVQSVAGRKGTVTLTKGDVGLANVDNTSDINKPVSTAQSTAIGLKVDKVDGMGLSTNDYTDAEKTKLSGIAAGANKYVHPGSHPASIITQTTSARFVTDAEKTTWGDKETPEGAQTKADTALESAKTYVDGKVLTDVPANAKFTDTNTTYGLMTSTELTGGTVATSRVVSAKLLSDWLGAKVKTNVPANAKFTDTVYSHPSTHPASMIVETTAKNFVSDTEKAGWDEKETPEGAQAKADTALGSAKTYVDGKVQTNVPLNAVFTDTKYTHPTKHPADIITESTTRRFVTDTEKDVWNAKETPSGAQTKATKALTDATAYVDGKVLTDVPANAKFTDTNTTYGLMTSTELTGGTVATSRVVSAKLLSDWLGAKVKTNVPLNAKFTDTVYSHPTNHPATIITQTASARFVTDTEKDVWNAKETVEGSTAKASSALTDAKAYVDGKVLTNVPKSAKFTDTVYSHPGSHPASMITETATKRFVTDTEKDNWNAKETPAGAQTKADTALGSAKAYVDGKVLTDVPKGAKFTDTVYSHPGSHPASIITETTTKRFVSDAEKTGWNAKETTAGATSKANQALEDAKDYVDGRVKTDVPENAKFTDTNTTYSAMPVAEGKAGTATSSRTVRADYLKQIIQHYDTTYTAGPGLTLSGTEFSLPVTASGTGTFVKSVEQTANGVSVTLGTPPNTNTTYTAMSVAEGKAGTATSLRTMRADYLKQIIQYYDTNTTYTAGTNIQISETNVISATDTKYSLPTASGTTLGGIKVGSRLTITSGTLSANVQSDNNFTTTLKNKLDGIATEANNYTLPVATATVIGGVELFSNTVQSVAANAVTTTASRTYGIQLNSAGQAVVNVPWSNTNTTYTAGTNIQISGTNVISATDTKYTHPTTTARASGLYKITVNTLGHVTGATAVVKTDITGLGISEVGPQGPRGYTGDKGDKPSHGWSGTSLRFENPNGTWGDYVNLKGDTGAKGATGASGVNATITSASATKLAPGATPTVTLGGSASARTFAFGIPEGAKGATGATGAKGATGAAGVNATITSASATGLAAGATPTVTLGGTASARTFAFGIPKGDTGATGARGAAGSNGVNATITSASATGLAAGATPTVTLGGTASARTFAFGIPKGDTGAKGATGAAGVNATITSASATGLAAGATPTVTLGGTASARTFAFGIPKGDTGATGARGAAGTNGTNGTNGFTWRPAVDTSGILTWTNNGSTSTPTQRDIKGPKGDTGARGPAGSNGTNGTNGFTWRPAVSTAGVLTWTNNGSTNTPTQRDIKGPKGDTGAKGATGAPGLTTSIKVNGTTYTQASGVITLPNYVPVTGGTFTGSITATKVFRSSDIRLKDNMCPIDTSKIDDIKLIEFNWKSDNKKDYGVRAQEVEKLYPELISTNTDGMKSVNYESLYAIKIARLEERIKELEDKLWQVN